MINCPSLELTGRMVSGLLSIASFSSENTASCFGNVRGKLPALLLGLDGCWSTSSALLFPLQWGTNHLIFTDNNEKPSLGLKEMLYCISPCGEAGTELTLPGARKGGNDPEHWAVVGLCLFWRSPGWDLTKSVLDFLTSTFYTLDCTETHVPSWSQFTDPPFSPEWQVVTMSSVW